MLLSLYNFSNTFIVIRYALIKYKAFIQQRNRGSYTIDLKGQTLKTE